MFYFDDNEADGDPPYSPIRLETSIKSAKINPQICPSNPDLVAFVSEGNIWVSNIRSGQEVRLTDVRSLDREAVSAGLPSYVIQEEFRRYVGFWWRPSCDYIHVADISKKQDCEKLVSYYILYEEVDESDVEVYKISSWDGNCEEYRFPKPGMFSEMNVKFK